MGNDDFYSAANNDDTNEFVQSVHPSSSLFVGTIIYSVSLLVGLATVLATKRAIKRKRKLHGIEASTPSPKDIRTRNNQREKVAQTIDSLGYKNMDEDILHIEITLHSQDEPNSPASDISSPTSPFDEDHNLQTSNENQIRKEPTLPVSDISLNKSTAKSPLLDSNSLSPPIDQKGRISRRRNSLFSSLRGKKGKKQANKPTKKSERLIRVANAGRDNNNQIDVPILRKDEEKPITPITTPFQVKVSVEREKDEEEAKMISPTSLAQIFDGALNESGGTHTDETQPTDDNTKTYVHDILGGKQENGRKSTGKLSADLVHDGRTMTTMEHTIDNSKATACSSGTNKTTHNTIQDSLAHVFNEIEVLVFDINDPDLEIEKTLNEFDEKYFEAENPSLLDAGFVKKAMNRKRDLEDFIGMEENKDDYENSPEGKLALQAKKKKKRIRRKAKRKEMRRLCCNLAAPYIFSGVFSDAAEIVYIVMLANYLGTDSLNCYIAVHFVWYITEILTSGLYDAQYTLVSHAVGSENGYLAGQYIQIAACFEVLYFIPIVPLMIFYMGDILTWFEYDEAVVAEGMRYIQVYAFEAWISTVLYKVDLLLDIIDKARFNAIMSMSSTIVFTVLAYFAMTRLPNVDMFALACISLVTTILYYVAVIGWAVRQGWFDPYWKGMFGNNALLTNATAAVKLLKNGALLSFGYVLYHSEWEALSFIASYHGAYELSAWLILGTIWGVLESTTEGVASAASVRVAYHLGNGDYRMAKSAGYFCILLGTFLSLITGGILVGFGDTFLDIVTPDEEMQSIISPVLPFIAFGNLVLVYGMVCSNLVEAQGRFRLATLASAVTTVVVTLPLSAIFVYRFNFDLTALAASVVIGYSTSSAVLAYFLLQSNWKKYADRIREENCVEAEDEEADEDDNETAKTALTLTPPGMKVPPEMLSPQGTNAYPQQQQHIEQYGEFV